VQARVVLQELRSLRVFHTLCSVLQDMQDPNCMPFDSDYQVAASDDAQSQMSDDTYINDDFSTA
jgi:hypothetical protein